MIFLFLFFGISAWAKDPAASFNEEKIYRALLPNVKSVEKPFTVFHWENIADPFAAKFKPDTEKGLLEYVRAASRSFLEDDASHGFYTSIDPAASRRFGGQDWRLLELQVPAGLKYLELRDAKELRAQLAEAMPGDDGSCARALLLTMNSKRMNGGIEEDFGHGECGKLKRHLFKRLGISAVRFHWERMKSPGFCGRDDSAFIFTNGTWLNGENVKGLTSLSQESTQDRRAIQEIIFTMFTENRHFQFYEKKALWPDVLERNSSLTPETRTWMEEKLINCQREKRPVVEATEQKQDEVGNAPAL